MMLIVASYPNPSEALRLAALHHYQVLDTEPEAAFERLVAVAQRIFDVPAVHITFVAENRQWLKAWLGFGEQEIDRDLSFCNYTIRQNDVMVVLDAAQDVRFTDNPLVTGEAPIRFYAGAPLKTSEGFNLGSLCLVDSVSHAGFSDEAKKTLADLADMVVNELEFRLSKRAAQHQAEFRRGLLSFTQSVLQRDPDESFYQSLLDLALASIPGAQAGSLLVERADAYHFVAASGYDLAALQTCTLSAEALKFDASTPEPELVYDWDTTALSESQKEIFEAHGLAQDIQVSLCVPIFVDKRPLVVLYLDNFSRRDAFDEEAIGMARVLAQQAATLLQRLELEAGLRRKQRQLEHAALYDSLTGLPNRFLFNDRLKQAAAQARRSGNPFAVLFLDLDNFKDINDTYGHTLGDALIAAVGARFSKTLREGDTLARFGGDEFAFLIPAPTDVMMQIAERLLESLKHAFDLSGLKLYIGASIGIAYYTDGAVTAEDVVKNADVALYQAKKKRNSYCFFDDSMKEKLQTRVELGEALRAALQDDMLTLHFQPRVKLATGEVTSLEALARWPHPTKGWISPGVFIPLAEELGLIGQLGAQVLDKACSQTKAWQQKGIPLRVAVNLSADQLKNPEIVGEVKKILDKHQLGPELLELEITESVAMADVKQSIEKLRAFRAMGIHLAVDDFGTAYSSLAYLKQLPVQTLKIDQSFVNDIQGGTGGANDTRIVEAILALAKSLNLGVVAEGVETYDQRRVLEHLGCEEAQGYLFSKPLPAAEVEKLLERKLANQKPIREI